MMEDFRGTKENPFHISCGGVVYRKNQRGEIEVLLLHRFPKPGWIYDSWHLPKGTRWKSEGKEDTVRREILEETGFRVEVLDKIGILKSTYQLENTTINKTTHYFLCRPIEKIGKTDPEHDEMRWIKLDRAIKLTAKFPEYEKEEKILDKFKKMCRGRELNPHRLEAQ